MDHDHGYIETLGARLLHDLGDVDALDIGGAEHEIPVPSGERALQLRHSGEMAGFHRNAFVAQSIEQRLDVVGGGLDDQQLQGLIGFHNRIVYLPDGSNEYRSPRKGSSSGPEERILSRIGQKKILPLAARAGRPGQRIAPAMQLPRRSSIIGTTLGD